MNIQDYLIDQEGIDWPKVLGAWSWLLPSEFTLWLVNRFADLFVLLPDGSIHMLDVGAGSFTRVAENRDEFCTKADIVQEAENWFMIPLVNRLVNAGILLKPGQCYGFKIPPVLGGEYTIENIDPISIADYLGVFATIHEQIRDLPEGAQFVLKVVK